MELKVEETAEILLGVAQLAALLTFELLGDLAQVGGEHGEDLSREGLGHPALRQLGELPQALAGIEAG